MVQCFRFGPGPSANAFGLSSRNVNTPQNNSTFGPAPGSAWHLCEIPRPCTRQSLAAGELRKQLIVRQESQANPEGSGLLPARYGDALLRQYQQCSEAYHEDGYEPCETCPNQLFQCSNGSSPSFCNLKGFGQIFPFVYAGLDQITKYYSGHPGNEIQSYTGGILNGCIDIL
jgi:hypothetical protein